MFIWINQQKETIILKKIWSFSLFNIWSFSLIWAIYNCQFICIDSTATKSKYLYKLYLLHFRHYSVYNTKVLKFKSLLKKKKPLFCLLFFFNEWILSGFCFSCKTKHNVKKLSKTMVPNLLMLGILMIKHIKIDI